MINKTIICCVLFIFSGCTTLNSLYSKVAYEKAEVTSCEEKAEPKSLQFLEQQYRCRGH